MRKYWFDFVSAVRMFLVTAVSITVATLPVAARQAKGGTPVVVPKAEQAMKAGSAKQKGTWRLQVSKTTPQLFLLKAVDASLNLQNFEIQPLHIALVAPARI